MAGTFDFDPVSGTKLGSDNIYTSIDYTINVTFTADDSSSSESLSSVDIVADINEDSITLSNGTSSCSIKGNYTLDLFDSITIKYVDKGSSDKIQTPIVVNKTNLVPANKDVFEVSSDLNIKKTITYTVTATTNQGSSATSTYTYDVIQTYDAIKGWIQDYFGGV